jgi:UDP-N-acetylglucosamine 2-epimerase (non-hydrolysing)
MHVLHIVGARPNFMKAAPVMAAFASEGVAQTLVHTGQHYDALMSDVFFEQLGMPHPDVNLAVGSGSHAAQTAEVMLRLEPVLIDRRPDMVLVYGDVNSTVAAAMVCSKLPLPIAHVEAGLRSFDRLMPEEINRIITDQLADVLFTPSEDGDENLRREGVAADKVFCVGNVMIDSLVKLLPEARRRAAASDMPERYALVTLHRPSNVDDPGMLASIVAALAELSEDIVVVFPVHPRTRQRIAQSGLRVPPTLLLLEPLGYLDFLALQTAATLIVTDSGGIQEESTFLQVPCLTVRCNTERPVTVTLGTNTLVGQDTSQLLAHARRILAGDVKRGVIPPLWDGKASERIARTAIAYISARGAAVCDHVSPRLS